MVLGGWDHEFTRRMRTEEGNNMGFDELLLQYEVSFILLLFLSFFGNLRWGKEKEIQE